MVDAMGRDATWTPDAADRVRTCSIRIFKSHKILLAPPLTRTLPIKHARTLAVALTKHSPLARGEYTGRSQTDRATLRTPRWHTSTFRHIAHLSLATGAHNTPGPT